MNQKVNLTLASVIFPNIVWANPNMFGGMEIFLWGGLIFLGLIIIALIFLFKARKSQSRKSVKILMLLPSFLMGLLLIIAAVKIAGHGVGHPGSVRDIFLTMFIPGIALVISVVFILYSDKSR